MRLFTVNFLMMVIVLSVIEQIDSRKITQKPKSAPKPPAPAPPKKSLFGSKPSKNLQSDTKPNNSWVRSMIDSAKNKFGGGKSAKKGELPGPTKKSLFDRAKEKVNKSGLVGKAVGYVKKDLGIGVVGPKQPSKILKYGKKAVEKIFSGKKNPRNKSPVLGIGAGVGTGVSAISSLETRGSVAVNPVTSDRVTEYLENNLEAAQQDTWNTSEAGTKYKLFAEKLNWNDAQEDCEQRGSHLAYLDSQSKNEYATFLLKSHNLTHAWFGMRTELNVGSDASQFENFADTDGCGVLDTLSSWSISSCSMELPYICQAFRMDSFVEIPSSSEQDPSLQLLTDE